MRTTSSTWGARLRLVLVAAVLAVVGGAGATGASDENVDLLRQRLTTLAERVDADLAALEALRRQVPLTTLDPSGADGVRVSDLLQRAFAALPTSYDSLEELESALEAVSVGSAPGLRVHLGCDGGCDSGETPVDVSSVPGGAQLVVPVHAGRTVTRALSWTPAGGASGDLEQPVAALADARGDLTVRLAFDTVLRIDAVYAGLADPVAPSLSLRSPTEGTLVADLSGSTASLTSRFGFTDLTGTASVTTGRLALALRLTDPDGTGGTTVQELATADPRDLVTVTPSGTLSATLGLDTPLTAASPDLAVTWAGASLASGLPAPTVSGPRLDLFDNVSPAAVFSGVAQLANTVAGLQGAQDVRLPLLSDGLAQLAQLADPVLDYVAANSVVCADSPTGPFTGSTVPVEGMLLYCQATAAGAVRSGSIVWDGDGVEAAGPTRAADHTRGTDADRTVEGVTSLLGDGPPRPRAVLRVTDPDAVDVRARYELEGVPGTLTAREAPRSAQQMVGRLVEGAGLAAPASGGVHRYADGTPVLAYDEAAKSLTFRLRKTFALPAATTRADVGDLLRAQGITGVGDGGELVDYDDPVSGTTGSVRFDVTAQGIALDLTFGVLLHESLADIQGGAPFPDGLPAGQADRFFVQVPEGPALAVDDVAVTGGGSFTGRIGFLGVALTATPTLAGGTRYLAKESSGAPMLALRLSPGSISLPGATVPRAVQFRRLAALDLTSGTGALQRTVNAALGARFAVTADVAGDRLGEGAVAFSVPSVRALLGGTAPTVTPEGTFDLRRFFDVGGADDPQRMFALLVQLLDSVTSDIVAGAVSGWDQPLPLLGKTPGELLEGVQRVRRAVQELSGTTGSAVVCGSTFTAGAVGGSPNALDDEGDTAAPYDLFCQLRTDKPVEAGSLRWNVTGGGSPTYTGTAAESAGPAPTGAARFAVAQTHLDGQGDPSSPGYRVAVAWRDDDGEHTAELPSRAEPPTLQALAAALTQELSLRPGALTLDVEDVTVAGGSTKKSLTLRLDLGTCTPDRVEATDVPACASADVPLATAPKVPLGLSLGDEGSVASLTGTGDVALSFLARAKLHLAVPLESGATPVLLQSTGLELDAGLASTTPLSLTASLGPLTVALGSSVPKPASAGGGPGDGVLKARLPLSFRKTGASPTRELDDIDELTFSGLPTTTTADCGSAVDGTTTVELEGLACAKLSVGYRAGASGPLEHLGELGVAYGATGGPVVAIPTTLAERLAAAALDPTVLLQALRDVVTRVRDALDTGDRGQEIPVLGPLADAGADVAGSLDEALRRVQGVLGEVKTQANARAAADRLDALLFQVLGPAPDGLDLLRKSDGSAGPATAADVGVVASCRADGSEAPAGTCTTLHELDDVTDLRVTAQLGQGSSPGTCTTATTAASGGCASAADALPFDLGLDGLPLRVSGTVRPFIGWRLHLQLGVDRTLGAYVGLRDGPELELGAGVELGDGACDPTADPVSVPSSGSGPHLQGFSSTRCLAGQLGFLRVQARDGSGAPGEKARTRASVTTELDLEKAGGSPTARITGEDLLAGRATADFSVRGTAHVDLRVRTLLDVDGAGLPTVLGRFTADAVIAVGSASGTPSFTAGFHGLTLDAGSFVDGLLGPVVQDVKKVTGPLKPVIDTLQSPLPVLTQLAALVGQPPVTLLRLVQATTGADLRLLSSVLGLLQLANSLPAGGGTRLVPLGPGGAGGSFTVDTAVARSGALTPEDAGRLVKDPVGAVGLLGAIGGDAVTRTAPSVDSADARPSTFGVKGLTFPVFTDASNVFKVMMGQDVDLVAFDAGTLRATAATSMSFGPFFIGPVPVTAFLGGSVTVSGRFAVTYDTSGLRKVLEGGSGTHLLDGVALSDFDAAGQDVPEITLVGTVSAGAAVDIVVARAGIEGGLRLTVDLNLNDAPSHDGKLRIEEIADRLRNPICLFDVRGALDAFLRFFLEVNLVLTSSRSEFPIVEVRLLDFSAGCSTAPPPPDLATLGGDGVLHLNVGTRSGLRGIAPGEVNESLTVRPVERDGSGPTVYEITGFGVTEREGSAARRVTQVRATALGGNDKLLLLAGGTAGKESATPSDRSSVIPFTAPAVLDTGAGNDVVVTGDGNDEVRLGEGTDVADLGGGQDRAQGDAGNDTLGGGGGVDRLWGDDPGNGSVTGDDVVEGGGRGDLLVGGPGADVLNGGPHAEQQTGGPAVPEDVQDGADLAIGGPGTDLVTGLVGDDVLFGGDPSSPVDIADLAAAETVAGQTCTAPSTRVPGPGDRVVGGAGDDAVVGGPSDDELVGGGGSEGLCGLAGDDVVFGDDEPGQTVASGPPGVDVLRGGGDNDRLDGGPRGDDVGGEAGNDIVRGGPDDDDLTGGAGRDVVEGGQGADLAAGDDATFDRSHADRSRRVVPTGSDTADTARPGCSPATGPRGTLSSTAGGSSDCVRGGTQDDVLHGQGGADTVLGDEGADLLELGAGDDDARGGPGDDEVHGRDGADTVQGDGGRDRVHGEDGGDRLAGDAEDDLVVGGPGDDRIRGDGGQDDLVGGSQTDAAPDGGDTIDGGAEVDVVTGDNATVVRPAGEPADTATDGSTRRTVTLLDGGPEAGVSGRDVVTGGLGNDRLWGQGTGDDLRGGEGKDLVFGGSGGDDIAGEAGTDHLVGGSAAGGAPDGGDRIAGGSQDDVVLGDNGTITWAGVETLGATGLPGASGGDLLRGGEDDDVLHGQDGRDEVAGEDGDDRAWGELDGDRVEGGPGADWLLGDQATVVPAAAGPATLPGGVTSYDVTLVQPDAGGADTVDGGLGDDRVFAGAEDDTASGGAGDDVLEGGPGRDTLRGLGSSPSVVDLLAAGLADDDDLLGGSSGVHPGPVRRDAGELVVHGDLGYDVVLGDNGEVRRTVVDGAWATDPVMLGARRDVVLGDRDATGGDLLAVSGGDLLHGDAGSDRLWGQGGEDVVHGDDGHDVAVGNSERDLLRGGDGEDDLVGGWLEQGMPDTGDDLRGGAGQDVLAGDNSAVVRPLQDGAWAQDPETGGGRREVGLHDTALRGTALAAVSGPDLLLGEGDRDRLHGQAGNDTLKGGEEADALLGNQDHDLLEGGPGPDDLTGGSAQQGQPDGGDVVHGGGDDDVAIGDNGLVRRTPRTSDGAYTYVTYQLGMLAQRHVKLLDVDSGSAEVAGGDTLSGGAAVDVLFGQGARDWVLGGPADDYLEGNGGSDVVAGDHTRGQLAASPPERLRSESGALVPALPSGLPEGESPEPALSGPVGDDGQDDLLGGSSQPEVGDGGDLLFGRGAADFLLGDNGELTRTVVAATSTATTGSATGTASTSTATAGTSTGGQDYARYVDYNPTTVVRRAERFDVAGPAGTSGGDWMEGGDGDDYLWGQDGDDQQYGGRDNDDMHGELGVDTMYGEDGEDAMVGDRGSIRDTRITGSDRQVTADTKGPAFLSYTGLRDGQLDRRVDLLHDLDGSVLQHNGHDAGGGDLMRGGRGHDSMHGGAGDDLMNGDSGGDWMFGADGRDLLWGGRGSEDPATPALRGEGDSLVDQLFGGRSGTGPDRADLLDYRPRGSCGTPGSDPCLWFRMTDTHNDPEGAATPLDPRVADNQHHQGVDWIYGGKGRDVLQGDLGRNGPDHGDRLMDWTGNYNLFTRCNASYGDDGDLRQHSPAVQEFLWTWAYGAGAGATPEEVRRPGTSAFRELALAYQGDKEEAGAAFPGTPGHFDRTSCAP